MDNFIEFVVLRRVGLARWAGLSWLLTALVGCGALTPDAPADEDILDGPIEGLSDEQLLLFLRGDEEFGRRFSFAEGLGPVFNAPSCDTCHPGDGRAHPEFGFVRFGRYEGDEFDPMRREGGPQLQDRAAPGYTPERLPAEATGVAIFLAPAMTGLGLLEAVDDETLLSLADPDDLDGDGISGRIHWVPADDTVTEIAQRGDDGGGRRMLLHAEGYIGRFGRKASNINLLHQAVNAYHQDMGITSDLAPVDHVNSSVGVGGGDSAPDPEVSSATLELVTFYLQTLRPPARRNPEARAVRAGEQHFASVGCASCHIPSLPTGASTIDALDRKEVRAYTDLLLHDMGPELDDGYAEGKASSREWRTTPLWGVSLAPIFQGGEAFYLHDGRARTLREAISFHGGEASSSRAAFDALSETEQRELLAFLESL